MNIEINKKINNDIREYQLKQYRILEKIQEELLENNKFLDENKPYINKMFYNELTNFNTYVNEYGYLITFTDNPTIHTNDSCPTDSIRQGPELYAFSHEGSVINNQPMCNIFGKNVITFFRSLGFRFCQLSKFFFFFFQFLFCSLLSHQHVIHLVVYQNP